MQFDLAISTILAGLCATMFIGSIMSVMLCVKLYTEFVKEKKYREP